MGQSKDSIMYPTQARDPKPSLKTITKVDRGIGAPFSPLSKSFFVVDQRLDVCQRVATNDEISEAIKLRKPFGLNEFKDPTVSDIVRAFRLISDASAYLEIGIFDRGNLAYASGLLADNALLVGVDIQTDVERDNLLKQKLKSHQTYISVIGSSRDAATVETVRQSLGGRKFDAVFIDGDHTAFGTMCDYALYEDMVSNNGVILFHDSAWEGNERYKGVCDALDEINRVDSVYLIDGANPVRRFTRPLWRDALWGVTGVIFASDQKWRKRK